MNFKKLLSITLSIVLIISTLPMGGIGSLTATAASTSDLTFTLNSDGQSYSVTDCKYSASGSLTIPSTYNGKPVVSIGDGAFYICEDLTSIRISNGVTSIGNNAFSACYSLTSITIPNSVISIGDRAFYNCTNLTSITIPDSVISIGEWTFANCTNLKNISIPDSISSMGANVFYEDNNITYYTYGNGKYLGNDQNHYVVLMDTTSETISSITIHPNTKIIYERALYVCSNLTTIKIPSGVREIGEYAFAFCTKMTNIVLPASVTTICDSAFYYCNKLSDVYYLGSERDCANIDFTTGNDDLLDANWYYNSCIGSTIHTYSSECDEVCNICEKTRDTASYHIYDDSNDRYCNACDGYRVITTGTTGQCTWTLDGTILTISGNGYMDNYDDDDDVLPWGDNGITKVIIEEGVTGIGEEAFWGCDKLTTVTIADSVTTIGDYAFNSCTALKNITFGNGLSYIGDYAFAYSGLESITFPDSLRSIGMGAFLTCSKLSNIDFNDDIRFVDEAAFEQTPWFNSQPNGVIYIGKALYAFKGTAPTNLSVREGTVSITFKAFYNCDSIVSLTIPNSITSIGQWAFYGCDGLESVIIGSGVTTIPERAFFSCAKLKEITIGKNVQNIKPAAFYYCDKIENVYFNGFEKEKNITISENNGPLVNANWHYLVCNHSFSGDCDDTCNGCGDKREVTQAHTYDNLYDKNCVVCGATREKPTGTTGDCTWTLDGTELTISGNGAMENYDSTSAPWGNSITSAVIEEGVTAIGNNAFANCLDLRSVSIASTVKTIGDNAFIACISLYGVVIPEGVESIGKYAFEMNESMNVINIPASVTYIDPTAFNLCWKLQAIQVSSDNQVYSSDDLGVLFNKEKTILIKAPTYFGNSYSEVYNYVIPDGVVTIGDEAFYTSKLTSITIPDSVSVINYGAFGDCKIQDVYYLGDETDRANISIDNSFNRNLINAVWHYNSCHSSTEHNFEWIIDTDENCGNDGVKHEECSACHKTKNENTVIPATGNHSYDNACDSVCNVCEQTREVPDHIYDNTCDTECNICGFERTITHNYEEKFDSLNHFKECSVCGDVINSEAHSYTAVCDVDCNVCGYIRTAQPHKKNSNVFTTTNSTTYPFSISNGIYSSTNKSDNSTSTFTLNIIKNGTVTIEYYTSTETNYDKLIIKHNSTEKVNVSGVTAWKTITLDVIVGDKIYITYSKDDSVNSGNDTVYFKLSNFILAEDLEPTCEDSVVCDICGVIVKPATGHDMLPATCTQPSTCETCGHTEGESLGHSYEGVITTPACTEQGYTTFTCSVCGDSYIDEYTIPKGHTYGNYEFIEATCTNEGGFRFYCDDCDDEMFVRTAVKINHEYIEFKSGCKFCKNCDYGEIPHTAFVDGEYAEGYGAADLDNDGKIGLDDLEILNSVVANVQFGDGSLFCEAADVNQDGKVDLKDVVRIKKILGIIPHQR